MLTDSDRMLLAFEACWWRNPAAKEDAIREVFDCSATVYHQRLNALIDQGDALAHDPVLVNRLRRNRDEHRTRRGRAS